MNISPHRSCACTCFSRRDFASIAGQATGISWCRSVLARKTGIAPFVQPFWILCTCQHYKGCKMIVQLVAENSLMMMMPFICSYRNKNERHHHHQGVFNHKLDSLHSVHSTWSGKKEYFPASHSQHCVCAL